MGGERQEESQHIKNLGFYLRSLCGWWVTLERKVRMSLYPCSLLYTMRFNATSYFISKKGLEKQC